MSRYYSVAEVRTYLSDILDQVEAGRNVHVTRRGREVAVMLSTQQYDALRRAVSNFGEAYRSFLGRHAIDEIGVDPKFIDSLRDRAAGRRIRL